MAANGIPGFYVFDPIGDVDGEFGNITVGLYPKDGDYTHGEFDISLRTLSRTYSTDVDYIVFEVSGPEGLRAFTDSRVAPLIKQLAKWAEKKRRFNLDDVRAFLVGGAIPERKDCRRITVDA